MTTGAENEVLRWQDKTAGLMERRNREAERILPWSLKRSQACRHLDFTLAASRLKEYLSAI
jgi:hypothetical protein